MRVDLESSQSEHETLTLAPHRSTPVISFIGQPNSGKTTLFNALTGSYYKTSNYAGTTAEISVGSALPKFSLPAILVDTPGITGLTSISAEEEIAIQLLADHPLYRLPELVVVTVDASQLARQLYVAKQVIDAGFHVVLAVTMNDLLQKKGFYLAADRLSDILHCPVVKINPREGTGLETLAEVMMDHIRHRNSHSPKALPKLTEKEIVALYEWAEPVQQHVLTPIRSFDVAALNRSVFNTRSAAPDAMSVKLDNVLLHPIWGLPIFAAVMFVLFSGVFWLAQPLMDGVTNGMTLLADTIRAVFPEGYWLGELLGTGIIEGAGAVLTFVPQIVILFLVLDFLEDSGYLARGAMLVDRPLSRIGLNGRSFVPMLSGFACAIPAIMAARTIPNRRERLITIFVIPLMTCSARLPVFGLLLAFLIPPDQIWLAALILSAIYLLSLFNGALAAGIVHRIVGRKDTSHFMLELPAYRKPVARFIMRHTVHKSWSYLQKAGPTILMCAVVIWALTYLPGTHAPESRTTPAERLETSLAADIGRLMEPAIKPLGWDWRIGVGILSAFAAREVFVSTIALTFRVESDGESETALLDAMRQATHADTGQPLFTAASAISIVVFFMFSMQCISTLAVCRKETGSWKIPMLQQGVYTTAGYLLALLTKVILNAAGIA
jgi:ferrous iron transport protein B